jgi:hypothetical protein
VPSDLQDDVRRRAKIEQQGDAGVSEIMKAMGQPELPSDRAPASAEVVRLVGRADARARAAP